MNSEVENEKIDKSSTCKEGQNEQSNKILILYFIIKISFRYKHIQLQARHKWGQHTKFQIPTTKLMAY